MNNKKFSNEFDKFVNLFYGLPVDFSNPQVEIGKYDGRRNMCEVVSDNIQSTIVTFGDSLKCEIVVKYVSNINHEVLKKDLIDRNKELEELKEEYRSDGATKEEIRDWIEDELPMAELEKQDAIEWNNKSVPCDFEGYVVTPDLAISYNDDLFQAMIGPGDSEKIIILYGTPDQKGQLQQLTMCSYNVFDFMEDYSVYADFDIMNYRFIYPSNVTELKKINPHYDTNDNMAIDCDNLVTHIGNLKSIGVNPEMQSNIDFQQFLAENGLESMYDHPLAAIFVAKNIFINQAFQPEEKNVKK